MSRSKSGNFFKSSSQRTSPCRKSTSPSRKRGTFNSLPRRDRLSRAVTRTPGKLCFRYRDRLAPTKPAPPVIRIEPNRTRLLLLARCSRELFRSLPERRLMSIDFRDRSSDCVESVIR